MSLPSWTSRTEVSWQTWVSVNQKPWCRAALLALLSTWHQNCSVASTTTLWMCMHLECCFGMCAPDMWNCPTHLNSVLIRRCFGHQLNRVGIFTHESVKLLHSEQCWKKVSVGLYYSSFLPYSNFVGLYKRLALDEEGDGGISPIFWWFPLKWYVQGWSLL